MPTPPKPAEIILLEGKCHHAKKDLEKRAKAEKELLTGSAMRVCPQVKDNPNALKEFNRINKLLKAIGKNDALYEGIINRYALLKAECMEFYKEKEAISEDKARLQEEYLNGEISAEIRHELMVDYRKQESVLDRQIMARRRMMLDIEKENIMTVASALRSIPKKETEEEPDDMAKLLGRRA